VTRRIRSTLAGDTEWPALSVSVGAAGFRVHGQTIEDLLRAADASLYRMKSQNPDRASAPAERS
jgi:GGDEF domain-containing protein